MDINRIRIYLLAIETGSLTKAAELLDYTPSAVSHMMHALEQEAGIPLLIRTNQGVAPTPAAETILPDMHALIRQDKLLSQRIEALTEFRTGQLTIGSYTSIAENWLPSVIRNFADDYPEIEIEIREGIQSELVQLLKDGITDLCFFSYQKDEPWEWIPLADDPIIALLPTEHPAASNQSIHWTDLENESLVLASTGKDLDILALLKKHKSHPIIRYRTHDDYVALSLIEAGLGIGIMNRLLTKRHLANVVKLPLLPEESLQIGIAIPSMKTATPAAQRFIEYVLNELRS